MRQVERIFKLFSAQFSRVYAIKRTKTDSKLCNYIDNDDDVDQEEGTQRWNFSEPGNAAERKCMLLLRVRGALSFKTIGHA